MQISENDRSRMLRPPIYAFNQHIESKPPEYWRWFDENKAARPRPLDEDELVKFLVKTQGVPIKEARQSSRTHSQAKKGDKAIWLAAQNPLVDRMIDAMKAEIEKHGLEVMSRYPNDLLIHDRNMLLCNAVPGAQIGWTVSDSSTHMSFLGLHPKKNEEVTYCTNLSSNQRFYLLKVEYSSFRLAEVTRDAFEKLARTPVPFSRIGTNESFHVMRGDQKIGAVFLKDIGNYCDRKYEVTVSPEPSLSPINRAALHVWANEAPITAGHTLFVRSITTWVDDSAEKLQAAA